MRTMLTVLFMTLAAQVSADDFLINCPNGELYKYSKSFLWRPIISVRKDADWKPGVNTNYLFLIGVLNVDMK